MTTPIDLMKAGLDFMEQSVETMRSLLPGASRSPVAAQARAGRPVGQSASRPRAGNAPRSAAGEPAAGPRVTIQLPRTTQGPFWPPAEVADENGNFVVVGAQITGGDPPLVPGRSILVSKDTVPPLVNGRENFDNIYGAPYKVLRELDLSPGSADLDIVLHTLSYGPREGDFGGGPRVPRKGDSRYNLNYLPALNPNLYPLDSLARTLTRPSYPLNQAPIWGMQNDLLVNDVEAGVLLDPDAPSPAEITFSSRRREPITLGRWLEAHGELEITLTRYDRALSAYTSARFDFSFTGLLPYSVYTIYTIRDRSFLPEDNPDFTRGEPLGIPDIFVTGGQGAARVSYEVENPFPSNEIGPEGLRRILGVDVAYKSDFQSWGGEIDLLAFGVSIHSVFNSFQDGKQEFTSFVTRAPSR